MAEIVTPGDPRANAIQVIRLNSTSTFPYQIVAESAEEKVNAARARTVSLKERMRMFQTLVNAMSLGVRQKCLGYRKAGIKITAVKTNALRCCSPTSALENKRMLSKEVRNSAWRTDGNKLIVERNWGHGICLRSWQYSS